MVTISLCMIVKNEERIIERCLDSVQHVVDEINIIDTGSTDRTKEIVENYTTRIFDFAWCDDFAKARNFSFQQATKDYTLWLDADDVLTTEHQQKLLQYRLVKRSRNFQWQGAVHEFLHVRGQLCHSDVVITHLPLKKDRNRNIRIYESLKATGHTFSARETFHYANELKSHQRYLEAINHYNTFLDLALGSAEDNIQACLNVADCYQHLRDSKQATQSLLQSLLYDRPSPDTCCRIGHVFMEQFKNEAAIYWYSQAIQQSSPTRGMQRRAYSTWHPHLQLSRLYDRLGLYENAHEHNEAARKYKPNDKRILDNEKYLYSRLNKGK